MVDSQTFDSPRPGFVQMMATENFWLFLTFQKFVKYISLYNRLFGWKISIRGKTGVEEFPTFNYDDMLTPHGWLRIRRAYVV